MTPNPALSHWLNYSFSGNAGKIMHSKEVKRTNQERQEVVECLDPRIQEIQDECLEQLKQVVLATAQTLQDTMITGVNEVIPIACLRDISSTLPISPAALGRIEHMTGYRMKNYQDIILSVTREYQKLKLDHLASQASAGRLDQVMNCVNAARNIIIPYSDY